jgi:hypothetical protein
MAIDAAVAFGVGEAAAGAAEAAVATEAIAGAADFAAMGALGDFSAMTLADVALPSAVGEAAAGTLAYAPLAATAEEVAAGLVPGMSSVAEAGVGAGVPSATGALAPTEALAGSAAPSASLAGSGAPVAGVTSGVGSAASSALPAGLLPEEYLGTSPLTTGLTSETAGLAPQSTVGSALGEGSQGLTASEITAGQSVAQPAQAVAQVTPESLGVTPAGATPPPTGQLAGLTSPTTMSDAITPEMEAAARGGGQVATAPTTTSLSAPATTSTAVEQAPAAYNAGGNLPSMATQPGVTAPAVPAAPAPAPVPPAVVGSNLGEGSLGLNAGEIAAGKGAGATAIGNAGAEGFGTQAMNYLTKNPSLLLSGAGLLGNMLMGQQQPKFQKQLSAEAQAMQAQGQQLASYLAGGNLPPGVQAQLNSAHEAAIASVRSQHANRGTSGSSMEAQDLQRINEAIVSQGASIATQLLQAGISEQQMAAGIYNNLMNSSLAQDQRMSQAVSGFTNALAYGAARPVG